MENLNLIELTKKECQQINGGENGWYYLGKASRWAVDRVCAAVVSYVTREHNSESSSEGCTIIC